MPLTAEFRLMKAPVNKIINFSNVDGPHNRTAIFFQGCNFNCLFCHNPETINTCIHCGACVQTCPVHALSLKDGKVVWDPEICVNCDTCIKTCTHDASPKITMMSVEDIMKRIRKLRPYIKGITTSGGECTLQKDFLIELFTEVRKLGLTCLIDSNGSLDFSQYPELLEVCDGVMLDVKASDFDFHNTLCAFDNHIVLKNLEYLLSVNKLYEVRTIIFPDRDKDNETTIRYVSEHIQDRCLYKIIKYRPFGVREKNLDRLSHFETEQEYAQKYLDLALSLGAEKAFIV